MCCINGGSVAQMVFLPTLGTLPVEVGQLLRSMDFSAAILVLICYG